MPELPEVETLKRGLNKFVTDREIIRVNVLNNRSFDVEQRNINRFVMNSKITEVSRRAKILIVSLSSDKSLVIHLKMTGQLVFRSGSQNYGAGHPNDSLIGELPDKTTRVILTFADSSKLFFNDQRKFGWMRLCDNERLDGLDFIKKLGPDAVDENLTEEEFKVRLLKRKNSNIKSVLLDQTVVAGIGNIYADESLWAANIHPLAKIIDLDDASIKNLFKHIREILDLSISRGGSTSKNYVNAEGKRGNYLDFANVYNRAGQECKSCNNKIVKIRAAGRGTHICEYCQRIEVEK